MPIVTDIVIQDYRSISYCAMKPQQLSLLVGKNGAGKSNILEAISFLADAIDSGIAGAIRARSGFDQIRRKTSIGLLNPKFWVRIRDQSGAVPIFAQYSLQLEPHERYDFKVSYEAMHYREGSAPMKSLYRWSDREIEGVKPQAVGFSVHGSHIGFTELVLGRTSEHEMSDIMRFALGRFAIVSPKPEKMRVPMPSRVSSRLDPDGANIASFLLTLYRSRPKLFDRIHRYVAATGAPLDRIEPPKTVGGYDVVEYSRIIRDDQVISLPISTMSDGSLRMLAFATALLGNIPPTTNEFIERVNSLYRPFLAIEEPETSLHPSAIAALVDLLVEGSESAQLMVTSHSPEVLDHEGITPEMITVVEMTPDGTVATPIGSRSLDAIRSHLVSSADLARQGLLSGDESAKKGPRIDPDTRSPWSLEDMEKFDD